MSSLDSASDRSFEPSFDSSADAPIPDPGVSRPPGTRLPALEGLVVRLERDAALDPLAARMDHLTAVLDRDPVRPALDGDWLGHPLHPLLTDLPIGFWTSAFALDLVGGRRARPAARRLTGLGVLSAAPTALSGWSEFRRLSAPAHRRVAVVHGLGNGVATAVYAASWWARRRDRHVTGVALGLAGAAIASVTGFLGGHLHGGLGAGSGRRGVPAGHAQ